MHNIKLYDTDRHKFIFLNESEAGEENGIRSNQYLIVHKGEGVLLDPGGYGVMPRVLFEMLRYVEPKDIKAIVLSHQDPDIVAGLPTWIEMTTAPIYISHIWMRFLPHYGIKAIDRFVGIPDSGMLLPVADDLQLQLIPAHFLHSEGHINVYDPLSKILFSGDIGAAVERVDEENFFVDQFDTHLPYIEWFHKRYMCSQKAAQLWVEAVSKLNIEQIAPQHGPVYRHQSVQDFLTWFKKLRCGIDLMERSGVFDLTT